MIINCRGIKKRYAGESSFALSGLDLTVEENTVFGFLGPNGSGKTTTIKILTGLMKPTSGDATVAGEEVNANSIRLRQKIGYLGQEHKMYGYMRGLELLVFVGRIFGFSHVECKKRACELLDMAGLGDAANKKISAYSGGMLQRLGIAQALMGKPEVLFLDEPTSALDPMGRKEILEFILHLKKDLTIFMSTHILSDVERICDSVAIIDNGKLVTQGSIQELKKKYSSQQIEMVFETGESMQSFIDAVRYLNWDIVTNDEINKLRINALNIEQVKNKIFEFISSNHVPVNKFEILDANLEDIFVKLLQ
jgi:ABC-2 type transport system ATP-binding protein